MEDAIKLAEFYKSPELLIFYCDHTCSYGKKDFGADNKNGNYDL